MGIPDMSFNVNLHNANATLNHPARHQTSSSIGSGDFLVEAVHLLRLLALLREVKGIGSSDLHSRGQLVVGDASLQFGLPRPTLPMGLVKLSQQGSLGFHQRARQLLAWLQI